MTAFFYFTKRFFRTISVICFYYFIVIVIKKTNIFSFNVYRRIIIMAFQT